MTDNELIPVTKHGEYLEVHPVALAQHEALGWVKCARQESADDEPDGAKKATVAELREALTAKGIAIPDGAKKAELQALLDAAQ
ncbi:HeH/LEM domain-containing protein [Acidovorax sp. M14]|uniref:HeH/LEM domain-containing protein n=1 Tax=Acidovorax sp. M14 TaxID=3411354 RepID=UPI003BF4C055